MRNKPVFAVLAMVVLAASSAAVGCATTASAPSAPKGTPAALTPKLTELLRKYMGPETATWDKDEVNVYYVDPLQFQKLKAELDAGGEYKQSGNWTDKNRDWERGMTFARLAVRPDGSCQLDMCKADNSVVGYTYAKVPGASGAKLAESLRRYIGPNPRNKDGRVVNVYYVDPLRFQACKAELEAGGEYYPRGIWTTKNRDWDLGKSYAQLVVFYGRSLELYLCKQDNSVVKYDYLPRPRAGEPKSITITGFDVKLPVNTDKNGVKGRFLLASISEISKTTAQSGVADGKANVSGEDITFNLSFYEMSKDEKSWTQSAWTENGSYYIYIEQLPPKDSARSNSEYVYSVNGADAAPVDINSAVTTLKWSDFIWFRDYN